jgi:hypothetical protein
VCVCACVCVWGNTHGLAKFMSKKILIASYKDKIINCFCKNWQQKLGQGGRTLRNSNEEGERVHLHPKVLGMPTGNCFVLPRLCPSAPCLWTLAKIRPGASLSSSWKSFRPLGSQNQPRLESSLGIHAGVQEGDAPALWDLDFASLYFPNQCSYWPHIAWHTVKG